MKIKFSANQQISWPKDCPLCLKPVSEKKSVAIIGQNNVFYCEKCYKKVERFENWQDGTALIAFVVMVLFTILGWIGVFIEEKWQAITQPQNWFGIGLGAIFLGGIAWAVLWLLFQILPLILPWKFARKGIKILKSKKFGIIGLKFSNSEYGERFQKINNL